MKHIKLTNGMLASVDDSDYDVLNAVTWQCHKGRSSYYAKRRSSDGKWVWMHREVLSRHGYEAFHETDHRDGDGLNNCLGNLRPATSSQNQGNQRRRRDNSSGFKGVSYHKRNKSWQARIRVDGRQKTIGSYDSAREAAAAYDIAARSRFGEFANTNLQLQEAI